MKRGGSKRRGRWVPLVTLSMSLGCGGLYETEIRDCSPQGFDDISRALTAIDENRGQLLQGLRFLSGSESDILKNMRKVKIDCIDQRGRCQDALLDAESDGFGDNIKLCYESIRDRTASFCALVGVIIHEKGHTDKVPVWPLHSHRKTPLAIRLGDPLFRAERVARDQCQFDWDLTEEEKELVARPAP